MLEPCPELTEPWPELDEPGADELPMPVGMGTMPVECEAVELLGPWLLEPWPVLLDSCPELLGAWLLDPWPVLLEPCLELLGTWLLEP